MKSIVYGYKESVILLTNENRKKINLNHSKDKNSLLNGLGDSIHGKFMYYSFAKEIWDKLQNIYEGDEKVKETKIQTYRGQFEQLKMKEDENIVA